MNVIEKTAHFLNSPVLPSSKPLVCVVDNEIQTRQSLHRLFLAASLPVCVFTSATEFLEHERHQGPCCLVIDPGAPGMDVFELQRVLTNSANQIIFLTARADVAMCAQAMKAGAADFLIKPASPEILLEATNRALSRSETILSTKAVHSAAMAKFTSLTSREFAVMQRVIAGLLNKQIAADLGIAEKTIKIHRGRVMRKTGVVSVADLVRLAIAADIPDYIRENKAS